MANTMPIPLPPRTPTPPPDESSSPQKQPTFDPTAPFDPNALSPHHLEPDYIAMAASSNYASAMTPEKQIAPGIGIGSVNEKGPFNFQTATLAKSPVIKSVCDPLTKKPNPNPKGTGKPLIVVIFTELLTRVTMYRILASDGATSINTAVYPTRSSSNLLLVRHRLCQPPSLSQRLRNAGPV